MKNSYQNRIHDSLKYSYCLTLIFNIIISLPFFIVHKSENPVFGPFSIEFYLIVFLPFLLITFICLAILLKWKAYVYENQKFSMKTKVFFYIFLSIVLVLSGVVFSIIPLSYFGTLLFFLSINIVLLFYYIFSNKIDFLLLGWGFLISSILIFFSEFSHKFIFKNLKSEKRIDSIYYWGDSTTFDYTYNYTFPFISKGGRLRPNLNIKMKDYYGGKGKTLVTNSLGFRNEKEFSKNKKENQLRILSLGDSQSNGFHLSQDSFFGSYLEKHLSNKLSIDSKLVEVLNVEISDPAFGAWYMSLYGNEFEPDIVLFNLSGHDIMQSGLFFGEEKLFFKDSMDNIVSNNNHKVKNDWKDDFKNFKYEGINHKIIKKSHIIFFNEWKRRVNALFIFNIIKSKIDKIFFDENKSVTWNRMNKYESIDGNKRMYDGTYNIGMYDKNQHVVRNQMFKAFCDLMLIMKKITKKNNQVFIVAVHPSRLQVNNNEWEDFCKDWGLISKNFDLKLINNQVNEFLENNNVFSTDLLGSLNRINEQLFLPADVHYNSRGAEQAAIIVSNYILKIINNF
ncbi:MAG: hypothetical protein ACJZ14_00640 [Candidatus Neomarinimicrobiota bacterium]